MSAGGACTDRAHKREGAWTVDVRNANYSRFNGGRRTPSAYSQIKCHKCGAVWRSKGDFVKSLPSTPRG